MGNITKKINKPTQFSLGNQSVNLNYIVDILGSELMFYSYNLISETRLTYLLIKQNKNPV